MEGRAKLDEAIKRMPATFGLRAFPGRVFRVSPLYSYVNDDGVPMLYTEVQKGAEWLSFAKGTEGEIREQIVTLSTPSVPDIVQTTTDLLGAAFQPLAAGARLQPSNREHPRGSEEWIYDDWLRYEANKEQPQSETRTPGTRRNFHVAPLLGTPAGYTFEVACLADSPDGTHVAGEHLASCFDRERAELICKALTAQPANLARHILAMETDPYLQGHPEWEALLNEAMTIIRATPHQHTTRAEERACEAEAEEAAQGEPEDERERRTR